MKNSMAVFNTLFVVLYCVLVLSPHMLITIIYGFILITWLIINLHPKWRFTKKIFAYIWKFSFPYTTDEAIILNCMKVVNFFIGKRFQLLHWAGMTKPKVNPEITEKTIFFDGFAKFDSEKWDKRFPWGDANNAPWNAYTENDTFVARVQKENYRGWWDGPKDFINTVGMIYSKNMYPIECSYEARIKFSPVNHLCQSFWLIRLRDEPLPKKIEEIDFEYHLSEGKITMSQHWGNGYRHDEFHRQESFGFKIDLSEGWHNLKFKFTKRCIYWYIDNVLVKWHFIGVPKMEQFVVCGIGNTGKNVTDIGKLDLNLLPTHYKCDWIKIDKN